MNQKAWNIRVARHKAWEQIVTNSEHTLSRRPTWRQQHGSYELQCVRYAYFEELEYISSRDVWIRCYSANGLCAVAQFNEWRVESSLDLEDFWHAADGVSSQSETFATIIMENWPDYDPPFDYGNAVHFDRLVVRSEADPDRMALKLIARGIEREFMRRASVLLLCAFPLEFENEGPDEPERANFLFARRRRAMLRRYRSVLGLRHVQWGVGRKYGWMWRPLRYCPEPVRRNLIAGPTL